MSEQSDLLFGSIADISARIRDGHLSPVELARHCLERIEALNPNLNAFITVTAQLALDQAGNAASEIRAGHWRGPLHGLPVAVKDFYDTAGIRTTARFEHFQNRVPFQDAELVVNLRNAGAVLVGKTNMHKLGIGTTSLESHFGPVVNPWSASHVAGGSSGGSAAAVAAGLCFATKLIPTLLDRADCRPQSAGLCATSRRLVSPQHGRYSRRRKSRSSHSVAKPPVPDGAQCRRSCTRPRRAREEFTGRHYVRSPCVATVAIPSSPRHRHQFRRN
jgi:Amidase